LKRCPDGTFEAAVAYRESGDATWIPEIVNGIIERFLEPQAKPLLHSGNEELRLFEDLGVDSLTMMEIVILVEETLNISFDNSELRELRTLSDIRTYMDEKAGGGRSANGAPTQGLSHREILSALPQQPPFLFLTGATVESEFATGEYRITGDEFFLEGHFKNNPVFPASVMLEALGQLGVLYLLKGNALGEDKEVDATTVFFKSCDGVRCHRVCRPGDILRMRVEVKRIRRPLAVFEGSITVNGEKAAYAEEITLAFDTADKPARSPQEEKSTASATLNGSHHGVS
jgi:3-hydroxyacyl-[acyl-carrier-protein] dehydratase